MHLGCGSRHFDAGTKGYLTQEERSAASSALRQGWIDQSRARGLAESRGRYFALRLKPGDEVKQSILNFVKDRGLSAVAVVTCIL